MQSIPYEILQLIASNLLPRNQCRLAMTSRWCYQWLYTDLLRWHARKQRLSVPIYNIYNKNNMELSILTTDKQTFLFRSDIIIYNLTKNSVTYSGKPIYIRSIGLYDLGHVLLNYRDVNILRYGHIHSKILNIYVNTTQSIFSLSRPLFNIIGDQLSISDRMCLRSACKHIEIIMQYSIRDID